MKYRKSLPQLDGRLFVTDGGLETVLIFDEGVDLRAFAAIDLLRTDGGIEKIRDYYTPYIDIAETCGAGFVLESATWRASADWGRKLGYSDDELDGLNERAITLLHDIRERRETESMPIVVSGCIGPRGDGYQPEALMSSDEAQAYHERQIKTLERAGVDMVSAITMTYPDEAIGIVRAACEVRVPVAVSFTVETDGRLITGDSIADAIAMVDAATNTGTAYYMINCAHPTHFARELEKEESVLGRIKGIRANASRLSHADLDEAEELDAGDPDDLALHYLALRERLPGICVLGGCCGTNHHHVGAIAVRCSA